VVAINGQQITEGANFSGLELKVGDKLVIEIYRGNRRYTVEVVAGPLQ
jgi:co-chaperonin GroES (HSP10)